MPSPTVAAPPEARDELSPRPFRDAPPGIAVKAVLALRRTLLALAHALVPPELRIFEMAFGAAVTSLLHEAARLRIADLLRDGPLDAAALAARTGSDADALHRTLRALAHLGVFTLRPDGRFENNRAAAALRSGNVMRVREYVEYFGSASNLRAWADLGETVRTGRNAFERVAGMSVWDWFERHPDERETFAQAMMGMTTLHAPAIAALYPFGELGVLCDVGGGRGTLLSELLVRYPRLRGVLCDGAGVIASARALLERRGVLDRVELVAGSFFDEVPRGADAYLLKHILHDWDDARCRQILGVVRRAMEPGRRLLVCEALVERNDAADVGAMSDVQMMVVCSDGRERSREELMRLLDGCGFRRTRIFASPTVSVLEAVAV